jgi:hypothetical protein
MTREIAGRRARELSQILQLRYFVILREDGTYSSCSADAYHKAMASGASEKLCIVERFTPKGV